MTRPRLTTRQRLHLFLRARGQCQGCGWRLTAGTRWEIDHVVPLALEGRNHADNLQVLCAACHGHKTRHRDLPAIAKARRIKARHLGAWRSARPLPGGRRSAWKRLFDRTVMRRG